MTILNEPVQPVRSTPYEARIKLTSMVFIGSYEACEAWTDNLWGQAVRIIGKDGQEYVVAMATDFTIKSQEHDNIVRAGVHHS